MATLARIIPNIKGRSSHKRAVLNDAIYNVSLYEASLRQQAILKQKCSKMLETTLKSVLLRVASLYITVSLVALQDNTEISSSDLMVRERAFTYLHID